jgi:hypothetical protein
MVSPGGWYFLPVHALPASRVLLGMLTAGVRTGCGRDGRDRHFSAQRNQD